MLKIVLFLFAAVFCYADELEDAGNLVKEKKIDDAVKLYTVWLDRNRNSEQFVSVLDNTLSLTDDINVSISLLEKYIPAITDRSAKRKYFIRLGEYAELSGNLILAQKSYIHAADTGTDTDYTLLYRSAVLLHYMGEYSRSEVQIMRILRRCDDEDILKKATLLLARSFMARGDVPGYKEIRKELLEYNDPVVLAFLDKPTGDFPLSPEYLLENGKIDRFPEVDTSLGLLYPSESKNEISVSQEQQIQRFLVQTGSFLDKENAEYLSRDLNNLGFKAFVEQQTVKGKIYNKVFINADSVEDARKLILKLKDKGYEGYPVY